VLGQFAISRPKSDSRSNGLGLFYAFYIAFVILTFTLPVRRPIMNAMSGMNDGDVMNYVFKVMPFLPVLAMVIIYQQYRYSKSLIFRWADKLADIRFLHLVALVLMPIALLLFALQMPGGWWTWSTLGLHVATTVLLTGLLSDRLPPFSALLAAGSIVALGAGLWEVMYQASMFTVYYAPQGASPKGLAFAVLFIQPMVLGGTAVILQLWLRRSTSWGSGSIAPRLNKLVLTSFGLFLLGIAVWHATGFWVDVLYDFDVEEILYQGDINYWSMFAYRSTKVALGLSLAFLYLPRRIGGISG